MKSPASRIESIGYILKVENLSPVLYYVMENTLVMESLEPFPGYHGKHVPTSLKPRNIYLMVKYGYDFEEIARLSREIHKSFPYRFSGTPAEIEIGNKRCHAIRIKFLESFEMVTELQGLYKDAGIRFRKGWKVQPELKSTVIFWLKKQHPAFSGISRRRNNSTSKFLSFSAGNHLRPSPAT